MAMQMQNVVSSALSQVGYDPDTQTLEVVFNNGKSYTHTGVPPDIYYKLVGSSSVGHFYMAQIKGKY